ncbi:MAG TPA: glycosyltransferase family 4 protein [Candidatus Limnocylindria bacterium]|nr:glycosyltransferase family 4 protein [Candidatus Limnocylindria bacterium]
MAAALKFAARAARQFARWVRTPFALVFLLAAAFMSRSETHRRRAERQRPRLVYGPVPIISIKYMSGSMRALGYETLTLVDERYHIHGPADFDGDTATYLADSTGWRVLGRFLGDYAVVARLMRRYDVFHFFFDGGYLRRTPLRWLEVPVLHLAGKMVVALPYGSDVAVPSRIRSLEWRHGLMRNYPELGRHESKRIAAIDHLTEHADYIVACLVHLETLPRWDLLTIHYYPIDTDAWQSHTPDSGNDGRSGPVRIVHAPNHRAMKGTEALVAACEALAREGLSVELRLLEGVPNALVHEEMERADIVAEQFLLGYGITAIEAMSLSKPVLSNLSVPGYYEVFRHQTRFGDCPIVSATPETLADELRRLVTDPELRRRIGRESREYVLREHSYDAMGRLWSAIYARLWARETADPADLLAPTHRAPPVAAPEPREAPAPV